MSDIQKEIIDLRISKLNKFRESYLLKNEQTAATQAWARIDELKSIKKLIFTLGEQKGAST